MKRPTILTFILLISFSFILSMPFQQSGKRLFAKTVLADGSWVEISPGSAIAGGISANSGNSAWPAAAMAADDTLYAAWDDTSSGDREIYIRKWNGSNWQEVGAGSASGGGISNNSGESRGVALAVDHSGTPYATWHDISNGNYEIYVRRWNGNFWEEVGVGSATGGGISNSAGLSYWPSIAFASDGAPFVTWGDNSSGTYEIYVRRFNGTTWAEVGTNSASGSGMSNTPGNSWSPEIEFMPDGRPVIAWNDGDVNLKGEIYVRQWNGVTWTSLGINSDSGGGISNTPGDSQVPSFEISPANIIYLSWQESLLDGSSQAYVKKWDGSNWGEVGADSASNGGISNNAGETWWPTLALGLNGIPYVAWYDSSGGQYQIYVRRWDGSQWAEVGDHSATNGGISNNVGLSGNGEIVVDSYSIPYTIWEDASSGNYEIYGRRWDPPPCFDLTTTHSGSGSDPDATPSNSIDCFAGGYEAGEVVGLTAVADNGWRVENWEGTDNNASTNLQNSVTMPAQDHFVKVNFVPSINYTYLATILKDYGYFEGPTEQEPNSSFAEANGPLRSGRTYAGAFPDADDKNDYFYIVLQKPHDITITLKDIPNGQDYSLVLYDSAKDQIGYSGNLGNADEYISEIGGKGKYYVRVYNTTTSVSAVPYRLTVTYE